MKEMRRDTETVHDTCECYVNAAEIKQGRWQEDPSECLRHCKAQFLRNTLNEWTETQRWLDGCGSLDRGVAVREFWSLYWCDMVFCGVGIDLAGRVGQDPNVDLIINTCQNIGFYSIFDPGPPPPTFTCRTEADTRGACSLTGAMQAPQATEAPRVSAASHRPTTSATPRATTTAQSSHAKPPPAVVAPQPTAAPPVATEGPPTAVSTASSTGSSTGASTAASTTSGSSLTGQGKAAIAICSVLALMMLICLVLVWLRRRKRRKASFHRALRSRSGLTSADLGAAGSPTPLISPVSSAMGTRTILTPPLRLRDRKFLPSILRPGSRSPSPPLTPLTPAYSPQPGGGGIGALFPASPICSPTTNKLIPRHERSNTAAATPRTIHPGYPPTPHPLFTSSPSPSPLHQQLTPEEATFTRPIPVPGSSFPNAWPVPGNSTHSLNRGSGSSCYTAATAVTATGTGTGAATPTATVPAPGTGTGTGGSSTAHSSLRHEIPIAIPYFMGAGGAAGSIGRGSGSGSARDEGATPTPPPLQLQLQLPPLASASSSSSLAHSYSHSPSPCRPPRPHEGMLEIPDLVRPAGFGSGGMGIGDGFGAVAGGGGGGRPWDVGRGDGGSVRAGSVGTPPPPPPPPLSPPPTRALPRPPGGAVPSPTSSLMLSKGPVVVRERGGVGVGSGSGSGPAPPPPPPPSLASGRTVGTSTTWRSPPPSTPPPPYSRLLGRGSPVPGFALGPAGKGQFHLHDTGHGRAVVSGIATVAAAEQAAAHSHAGVEPGRRHEGDLRGSWGSWSGAGTVVGSGNFHFDALTPGTGVAGTGSGAGVKGTGHGNRGEPVSPRTSESSDVTATGETVVSRMSSMRDDTVGGKI